MAKRNANGSGSIRKRKDGTWEGRFTVGRDPRTGRQVQRSVYGRTQSEARQKLTAATREIDDGTYLTPNRMTVAAWCELWLSAYTNGVRESTRAAYASQLRSHIIPALGRVQLSKLTAPQIQQLYNGLTLSPSSVKILHRVFRQALQRAVDLGYLRANPANLCTLPRVEKSEIKPLNDEQTRAFLEAIEGHRFEHAFKLALFTGMRQGELLGLRWSCVDLEAGTLVVDKQLARVNGSHHLTQTKSGKTRTLALAPQAVQTLKARRAEQTEHQLKAGYLWENPLDLVFTNELGCFITLDSLYSAFKTVARRIGCPDARFHDLRHSYAVSALRAGVDIKTLQTSLGHSSATITLDIYAHATLEMQRTGAEQLGAFLKGVFGRKG